MGKKAVLAAALAALALAPTGAGPAGTPAHARCDVREVGAVHAAWSRCRARAARAAPCRALRAQADPLERRDHRTREGDADAAAAVHDRNRRRRERRPLQPGRGVPERPAADERRARIAAEPGPLQHRDRARRHAARRSHQVRRHVAGRGTAPAARAEQGSGPGRDRAVHVGVRAGDPGGRRDGRGRAHSVPGGRAASRPRRHRRAGKGRRRDSDSAGRRSARRSWRDRRRSARNGGAPRFERDRPPDPDPGLVGARRRGRRRAGARARRPSDLPLERRVHDRPARSACASRGDRPDAGRPHRARHDRRTASGLQRRDDELRARVVPDAPRCVDRVGARRRRLVHDGVRGHTAQPAFRSRRRALDRRVPQSLLLRSARSRAGARRRVAERRQRQRPPDARLQDRASLDGERAADRSRRQRAARRRRPEDRRRHVPLSAGPDRARGNLALRRRLDRRHRPRVAGRAVVLAQQHARVADRWLGASRWHGARGLHAQPRGAGSRNDPHRDGFHASHAARPEPRGRHRNDHVERAQRVRFARARRPLPAQGHGLQQHRHRLVDGTLHD